MKKVVNYARGSVRLRAEGGFPERLINLCAQRGLTFWGVEWPGGEQLRMTLLRRDLAALEELAERAGCVIEVERREGLPFFLERFRRRYAFLVGMALSALAVCLLSSFILTIEVTGCERVPEAVILSQLRRLGLRPGVYGPGLDTKHIALETRLAVDGLSWVTVNLYGTRAQVVVREEVPPPALLEEEGLSDVTARAGGLVTRVEVLEGQALVAPGDTVAPGEVVISGTVTMEGPEYSGLPPQYLYVRAEGSVWARTWRTLSASIPLEAVTKAYTGEQARRWSLTIFDRRVNFYGNGSISWESYDKISVTHAAVLPGGQRLPLYVTEETLARWQPAVAEVDAGAAQDLLERQLLERLERLVGPEGRVAAVSWSARIENGVLTVTAQAECEEQIGLAGPARESPRDAGEAAE